MPVPTSRRASGAWLVVLVLLVVAALVAWLWPRSDEPATAAVQASGDAVEPEAALRAGAEPTPEPPGERAAVATQIPTLAETADPRPPDPPSPVEVADLAARDELALRVVDAWQAPIFDAAVTIRGLRKQGEEDSWYGRRDEPVPLRTDPQGRVRVPYERWTDIDAKTVRVDLVVEHPDFVSFADDFFLLAPGEHVITLQQGSMVWVSAWHGSRERIVADVRLQTEWQAQLGRGAWRREPDGRWSTTHLAPGEHWITATHASAELGELASDFTSFELAEHGRVDLELELKPLETLHGRLDDAVPRPIVDGHVWINLHVSRANLGLSSDHEVAVAPDGTFEVPGLRRATGQVIALCDGWASKLVPARTWAEAGITPGEGVTEEQLQEWFGDQLRVGRFAQAVDVSLGAPLVVEMEPTGELEVRVVDDAGQPLAGVELSAWPNVRWEGVGSEVFPWRDWLATTDADGVARVANLPVDEHLMFGASSTTHRLRKPDRDVVPSARIESGKTTRCELVLEAIP